MNEVVTIIYDVKDNFYDINLFLDRLKSRKFADYRYQVPGYKENICLAFISEPSPSGCQHCVSHIQEIKETMFKEQTLNITVLCRQKKCRLSGCREIGNCNHLCLQYSDFSDLFDDAFNRADDNYFASVNKLWKQTVSIVQQLTRFISVKTDCIIPFHISTYPLHLPLSLSLVIASELYHIPVLNYKNAFHWQPDLIHRMGYRVVDYDKNFYLGEIQSLLDNVYAWDSPLWFYVVSRFNEFEFLVCGKGVNPNRVVLSPEARPKATSSKQNHPKTRFHYWVANEFNNDELSEILIQRALSEFNQGQRLDSLNSVLKKEGRVYTPGYAKLEYMIYLKSIITPEYFRVEEKELKGRAYQMVNGFMERAQPSANLNQNYLMNRCVERVFSSYCGENSIVNDVSYSYRYRTNKRFLYSKYTELELYGILGIIYRSIFEQDSSLHEQFNDHPALNIDIREFLNSCYNSDVSKINDVAKLLECIDANRPICFFAGRDLAAELNLIALILKQKSGDDKHKSKFKKPALPAVTYFVREKPLWSYADYESVVRYVERNPANELYDYVQAGEFKIVKSRLLSAGTNLKELGAEGLFLLNQCKQNNGILITLDFENLLTSDLIDLDAFHLGTAQDELSCNFLAIEKGSAYILFVPAGYRPSIAFPTPLQTPREFHEALSGEGIAQFRKSYQERIIRQELHKLVNQQGFTVAEGLTKFFEHRLAHSSENSAMQWRYLKGQHADGEPYNGAILIIRNNRYLEAQEKWTLKTVFLNGKLNDLPTIIESYAQKHGGPVKVAWNGGFIAMDEELGQMGLPSCFMGSILGLFASEGEVLALPLFNKASLLLHENGKISIKRTNLTNGVTLTAKGGTTLQLSPLQRNIEHSNLPSFYDLMFDQKQIVTQNRRIFYLAENRIVKIIQVEKGAVDLFPIGITLSVPDDVKLEGWDLDTRLDVQVPELGDVESAVEAGPMLIQNGQIDVDMEIEGWNTKTSAATQSSKIDENLRGPRIGAGVTRENDLVVMAINGRIRESAGATYKELASIMLKNDVVDALGFDSGGSATLFYHTRQLNITPHNDDYESNIYSLKPEPRPIGNAILIV